MDPVGPILLVQLPQLTFIPSEVFVPSDDVCVNLRVVAGLSLSFGFRQKALLVVEIELCQVVVRGSAPRNTRGFSVDYKIRVKCRHGMPFG